MRRMGVMEFSRKAYHLQCSFRTRNRRNKKTLFQHFKVHLSDDPCPISPPLAPRAEGRRASDVSKNEEFTRASCETYILVYATLRGSHALERVERFELISKSETVRASSCHLQMTRARKWQNWIASERERESEV